MLRYADFTHRLSRGSFQQPPNEFSLAYSADKGGALRNQIYVGGHFKLEKDEAFVVHVSDGGAAYFVVPIANVWGTTLEIMDRTSSLNKAQSVANPDGTYTYVISRNDPGVHNWIDPCDMDEGMLTLRMAEFPDKRPNDDLSAQGEVMKLAELKSRLPEGTPWVTPAERAQQQADRAAAYKRRLPEVQA